MHSLSCVYTVHEVYIQSIAFVTMPSKKPSKHHSHGSPSSSRDVKSRYSAGSSSSTSSTGHFPLGIDPRTYPGLAAYHKDENSKKYTKDLPPPPKDTSPSTPSTPRVPGASYQQSDGPSSTLYRQAPPLVPGRTAFGNYVADSAGGHVPAHREPSHRTMHHPSHQSTRAGKQPSSHAESSTAPHLRNRPRFQVPEPDLPSRFSDESGERKSKGKDKGKGKGKATSGSSQSGGGSGSSSMSNLWSGLKGKKPKR